MSAGSDVRAGRRVIAAVVAFVVCPLVVAASPPAATTSPSSDTVAPSGTVASSGTAATSTSTPTARGGGLVLVDGRRVLDSRTGLGVPDGTPGAIASTLVVDVTTAAPEAGEAVPGRTAGVLVTVTAVAPSAAGYVRAGPPEGESARSILSFVGAVVASGTTVVQADESGRVELTVHGGPTDLVVDVLGYYTAEDEAGGRYHPLLVPMRLADSRLGTGLAKGPLTGVHTLGVGSTVPRGVRAVVLDVSVTDPRGNGFVRVSPAGTPAAVTAFSYRKGASLTAPVFVRPDADGRLDLRIFGGPTDLVVDLLGYYDEDGQGAGAFESTPSTRLLDTRIGLGSSSPRPAGFVDVAAPAGVTGTLLVSVTVLAPRGPGYLRLRARSASARTTALTYTTGVPQTVLALVETDRQGRFTVWQYGTPADLVVDLLGMHRNEVDVWLPGEEGCRLTVTPVGEELWAGMPVNARLSSSIIGRSSGTATVVATYGVVDEVAYRAPGPAEPDGDVVLQVLAPRAGVPVVLRAVADDGFQVQTCAATFLPRAAPVPSCGIRVVDPRPYVGRTISAEILTGLQRADVTLTSRTSLGVRTLRGKTSGNGAVVFYVPVGWGAGTPVTLDATVRYGPHVRSCRTSVTPRPRIFTCKPLTGVVHAPSENWTTGGAWVGVEGAKITLKARLKSGLDVRTGYSDEDFRWTQQYLLGGAQTGTAIPLDIEATYRGVTKRCSTVLGPLPKSGG